MYMYMASIMFFRFILALCGFLALQTKKCKKPELKEAERHLATYPINYEYGREEFLAFFAFKKKRKKILSCNVSL